MKLIVEYKNKFIYKCSFKEKHIIIVNNKLDNNYQCELNHELLINNHELMEYITSTYNGKILDQFNTLHEKNIFKCNNIFHNQFEATPHNIIYHNSWCPQNSCTNSKYEHACRTILTYLFTFYNDSNILNDFNLQDIDINQEYYTLDELKQITNYDKIKYYFPVIRPNELLIDNLSDDIKNGHNRLEIDCYNENLRIGLEVDGRNHFQYDNFMHNNNIENFKRQQQLDNIKDQLCLDMNIKLLRIPHHIYTTNLQNTKKYLYDLLVENNIILNNNFNYDDYMQDNHPIIRNMIYNNFGGTNSIKLINLIKSFENRNDYQFSKYVLDLENNKFKFNIICDKNHDYQTNYHNLVSSNRNCPQCARNAPLNTNIVNDILCEYNVQLDEEYLPPYNKQRKFRCTTIFNHEFKSNWDTIKEQIRSNRTKCKKCKKILDHVPIYKYDLQYNFIKKFNNLTTILQSDIYIEGCNIKLEAQHRASIKTNIQRLNNFAYNHIWSYLEPIDNKLDHDRELTEFENNIKDIL